MLTRSRETLDKFVQQTLCQSWFNCYRASPEEYETTNLLFDLTIIKWVLDRAAISTIYRLNSLTESMVFVFRRSAKWANDQCTFQEEMSIFDLIIKFIAWLRSLRSSFCAKLSDFALETRNIEFTFSRSSPDSLREVPSLNKVYQCYPPTSWGSKRNNIY